MRLLLTLQTSKEPAQIPFGYQYTLAKQVHRWIGKENPWHDEAYTPFCFGAIKGLKTSEGNLTAFAEDNIFWQLAARDQDLLKLLISGINQSPHLAFGLRVKQVQILPVPSFQRQMIYHTDSPIFLRAKRASGNHDRHVVYSDRDADQILTNSLHSQLKHIGLEKYLPETQIKFLKDSSTAKTKLIALDKQPSVIKIRASACPIALHAPEEVHLAVWSCGLGASTGIGFGMIR